MLFLKEVVKGLYVQVRVSNTQDVMIVRPHIKMLSGDYLTYSNLSHDRGVDPCCRLCKQLSDNPGPVEDLAHLLTSCRGISDTKNSVMPDFLNTVATSYPTNGLLSHVSHLMTTQFLLDCLVHPLTYLLILEYPQTILAL